MEWVELAKPSPSGWSWEAKTGQVRGQELDWERVVMMKKDLPSSPALKLRVTPVVGQNGFGESITPSLASSSSR